MKWSSIVLIVLAMGSAANGDLTLTVNGLDTAKVIFLEEADDIIIGVAGETDAEAQSYSVTCEMGGSLEPVGEANTSGEEQQEGDYVLTLEDGGPDLAIVNLTAGNILDYQVVIFKMADMTAGLDANAISEANVIPGTCMVVFGIDSDAVQVAQQEEVNEAEETDEPNIPANPPLEPTQQGEGGQSAMGQSSYIELQEITDSVFLDPNMVYYVPYPPLLIHGVGEEIDVVIPSGTTIVLAEDWHHGIRIYDGANVYFGEPAPEADEPDGIYVPGDTGSPAPPVWVVGEDANIAFVHNLCGILVERTAGTCCRLNNINLRGFYFGIQVDQQLDYPIMNINTYGCYNGITSFGGNVIANCVVSFYGLWTPEFPNEGYAYEFVSESLDGSIFFEEAYFEICNCLANDGEYGFTAWGLEEPNDPPSFYSTDCAATNNYTAFNCINGSLGISVLCPGLYNNTYDKNFDFTLDYPVYDANDPLIVDPNDYRIFLNPDSNFVDNGSRISPFYGWTTDINGMPDEGTGDIWPHYQTKIVNALDSDLNADGLVDELDLSVLTDQWLIEDPISADYNNDGEVDFYDFSHWARQWTFEGLSFDIIETETYQTIDANDVSGLVGIQPKNIPVLTQLLAVYVDNVLVGEWVTGWDELSFVSLETDAFSNGWHTIRLVSYDIYGSVYNHAPVDVRFNNLLHTVVGGDQFHPDEDYRLRGFYDGTDMIEAKLTNMDDVVIWSDTYSGDHIDIVIPGPTFGSNFFCELRITETPGGAAPAGAGDGIVKKDLKKKFKKEDYPVNADVYMAIILPNPDVFDARWRGIKACATACNNRGVGWLVLYHHDVTEENLMHVLRYMTKIRYVYWMGHANSHVGTVQRTHTECWQLKKGLIWDSWKKRGAFSYTRQTVGDRPLLPDDWDQRGFDFTTTGMVDNNKKKIVFIDGCISADWVDLAQSFGMYSLDSWGSLDQVYIGWRQPILVTTSILEPIINTTTDGVEMFWERMGQGNSVNDALRHIDYTAPWGVRLALFGPNGTLDLFQVQGDDNLYLWCLGGVNIDTIYLGW
ncbi:MAG: dockerin type I domain-containing protein [Planctomycetota bacterium]